MGACTPHFIVTARVHRSPVGHHWQVDETYIKIGKRWYDLFRAIDEHGHIVDVYLRTRRGTAAAEAFFETAIDASTVPPRRVTTDKAKCYPLGVWTLVSNAEHHHSKYLNNSLERDHQHLKGGPDRCGGLKW
jgi:transposase-like protein